MENTIDSIPSLLEFFKTTKKPLFFIGPILRAAVIVINDFMPTFEILTCNDPFFAAHPFFKIPEGLQHHQCRDPQQCICIVLRNPATLAYIKGKDPNPCVMFGRFTPEIDQICKENGLTCWAIDAKLYQYLGNKVSIIDVLKKANVPFIPNICGKIESYTHLMEMAIKLKTLSIVIQNQQGIGGTGTFFINTEEDYKIHQKKVQNGAIFKIMPFRRLKGFAINGVATHSGSFLGPLYSELIGHPLLTEERGGYCGNELRSSYYEDQEKEAKIRLLIYTYAERLGNFIHGQFNYRGIFGFDFVVDEDTNEVFLMEINPRPTGSSALSNQLYEVQGYRFPLFLFHFLEFMGVRINIKAEVLNKEWMGMEHYHNQYSNIYVWNMKFGQRQRSIPAGFWRLEKGELVFASNQFRISKMKDGEIFFFPDPATQSFNIVMKGRCQSYQFKLLKTTEELVEIFLSMAYEFKAEVGNAT